MKAILPIIITLFIVSTGKSQIDTVTSFTTVIKPESYSTNYNYSIHSKYR